MTETACIRLRPGLDGDAIVAESRGALAGIAGIHGIPSREAKHAQIALDELLSNLASHSSAPPCEVELSVRSGRLTLRICDKGARFDPTEPPYPDPADRPRLGGRGLDLVRRLADTLTYRREAGVNEITFTKNFTPILEAAVTQGLTIAETRDADTATVALEGRIDSGNAGALTRHLTELTEAGHRHLVIDFAGLDYLTSAGFRTLLIASDAAEALEGGLRLRNLSEDVRELFEMSGLIEAFEVE